MIRQWLPTTLLGMSMVNGMWGTHIAPPPIHSLTPWSKDATYTPKGVQMSSPRKLTMSTCL